MPSLIVQIVTLFVLAIPIACVAWTVTHEEIFSEPREFCKRRSQSCKKLVERKFFYLFTCEYCFSHYVTALFVVITRFKLLYADWRGYMLSLFALVWIANVYMSFFGHIRLEIKRERVEIEHKEAIVHEKTDGGNEKAAGPGEGTGGSTPILISRS